MGKPQRGKKARAQEKKKAKPGAQNTGNDAGKANGNDLSANGHDVSGITDFAATGVLVSHPDSRDIKIDNFSLTYKGNEFFKDCSIELNYGNRYGLIGRNGSGKSTLLKCLATREVPIPKWIDIYHLDEEASPTDMTALQTVVADAKAYVQQLEAEQLELMATEPDSERLALITERLEGMDPDLFEKRAGELLYGLGFNRAFQAKMTKDMSGGWRMRVSLAKALFVKPMLLLLDEPSAHLDMESTIWLEEYLKTYPGILLLVSHSQDFLNNVCTHTLLISQQVLTVYTGNYDTYVKTRAENETNQMKHYKKQQEEIKHYKEFIASCGTFSNLVKQAKSRQKILDKMEADGLVKPVQPEPKWNFTFSHAEKLPPPVFSCDHMYFSYPGGPPLYEDVTFGLDSDSRVALVGPNGAGKSTLVKLICGDLAPTDGQITRHSHLRFARYHQHSKEMLPMDICALQYMREKFPEGYDTRGRLDTEQWRAVVGRYGLTGKHQLCPISHLSEGQQSKIVFMCMVLEHPNFLLLDEPTNSLDMATIDALAEAINKFDGGVVLVSHDFRLINQVAEEIWECKDLKVTKISGDIQSYKKKLRDSILADSDMGLTQLSAPQSS